MGNTKLRFGVYEADIAAGELRKYGLRIRLQKQPFEVLAALLNTPNQIVTREELRKRIWGDDTIVDFEHGLNAAVNKLRQALGDSSDTPRYVETVPGTGYRLLIPVETIQQSHVQDIPARVASVEEPNRRVNPKRALLPMAMLAAGVVCGWVLRPAPPASPARLVQFTVPMPEGFSSELAGTRQDFAVSPDGSRLAFVASDASRSQLWIHDFATLTTRPIGPDRTVRGVVWAPDSRSMYFDERNTLREITIDGNVAHTLCELPLRSPWMGLLRSGSDLTLYTRAGTFAIPRAGGTPRRVDDAAYRWTQALPGNYLLNIRYDEKIGRYRALASNLQNPKDERALLEVDSRVSFAPHRLGDEDGHLLYVRAGTLVAQPFRANSLRLTGDPVAVADEVFSFSPTGAAAFSVSENGVLVYRRAQGLSRLKWLDRTGRELARFGTPATFMTPLRLSPDGRRIAASVYEVEKGGMSVWVYDSADGTSRRLTSGSVTEAMAVWSPDGERIAFGRAAGATPKLYSRSMGNHSIEALPQAAFQLPTDWSRDGRFILYQTTGGAGEPGADVVAVDLRGARKIVPILHSEAQEVEAVLSPDGGMIAFNSDDTGRPELYLQPFASDPEPRVTGVKRQISYEGASTVRWRADGRELYYIDGSNWLTAVQIGGTGQPGTARKLFHLDFPPRQLTAAGPALGFDVSADGTRFLVPDTSAMRPTPFTVVENWTELLRRSGEQSAR